MHVRKLTRKVGASSCPPPAPTSSRSKCATSTLRRRSTSSTWASSARKPGPPHAVVFETKPIAFALRDVIPGTDLASVAQPGIGAAIWLHATDVQAIHDALVADGHTIVSAPIDGPFGRTFTFADPDGYQVTLHDRA